MTKNKDVSTPAPIPIFDSLTNMQQGFAPQGLATKYTPETKLATAFIMSYRGSEATFNAYRREVERILQWCWLVADKSLYDITRNDIELFIEFCQAPPKTWIGMKNVARFISKNGLQVPNPEWRPFVASVSKAEFKNGVTAKIEQYSLSERAIKELLAINSSFFNYLMQEGIIAVNPVSQLRQKSKFIRKQQPNSIVVRRLSDLQWSYVIETAELMAEQDAKTHERTLFIMTALYAMYLRISELSASKRWTPRMRDFYCDMDGNWWFRTVGKGNKERIISVSNKMLSALNRYRVSLDLTALPDPSDMRPLILKQKGMGAISSTRQIRSIVQQCFDATIIRMRDNGFVQEAQQLESVTAHWLRHTGISDDVKIRPREHVRDDAGHSSSAITDKYIDIELRARHASAKNKPVNPFQIDSKE